MATVRILKRNNKGGEDLHNFETDDCLIFNLEVTAVNEITGTVTFEETDSLPHECVSLMLWEYELPIGSIGDKVGDKYKVIMLKEGE